MNEPGDYYTKWSKSDKDEYYKILLIMEYKKDDADEFTYKTDSQTQRKTYGFQRGKIEGV